MASFNKVILMGRLVAAPELKTTPAGLPVTSFVLAVDRKYSKDGEKKADFITVVAWRQTAEFVCKYFARAARSSSAVSFRRAAGPTTRARSVMRPRWWLTRSILSSRRRAPKRVRRFQRATDLLRSATKICRSDGGSNDRLALPSLCPVPLQGARHLQRLS